MGITLKETGTDLLGEKLYIEDRGYRIGRIAWSPRIGIRVGTEHPWRCYAEGTRRCPGRVALVRVSRLPEELGQVPRLRGLRRPCSAAIVSSELPQNPVRARDRVCG